MRIHPIKGNRRQRDHISEYHESKGREWCEKCKVYFDAVSARRHRH